MKTFLETKTTLTPEQGRDVFWFGIVVIVAGLVIAFALGLLTGILL